MHNWEYKHVIIGEGEQEFPIDIDKELTALGQEGWEFCCSLAPRSSLFYVFLFKRPLYDEKSWDRAMDGMLDIFDDEEEGGE